MNVIGLTGLAGSGKSTVANYLVREHGYTRLSFAGPVRDMLRAIDPYLAPAEVTASRRAVSAGVRLSDAIGLYPHDTEAFLEANFPEYRRLVEALAATHDPDYWVDLAEEQLADANGLYVFDDVSTQQQADIIRYINKWGLWHIDRPVQEAPEPSVRWLGEVQTLFNVTTPEFLYSEADRALRLAFSDTAPLAEAS